MQFTDIYIDYQHINSSTYAFKFNSEFDPEVKAIPPKFYVIVGI